MSENVSFEGLQAKNVTVRFDGLVALDNVSLNARTGNITGIVGPNGAGKSSFLNAIMGLVPLAGGTISINDITISNTAPWKRIRLGLGRAFQHVELFGSLTVEENVLLGRHHMMRYGVLSAGLWLRRARVAELSHRKEVDSVLGFFELERWRSHEIKSLPYAVQKIVGLARAVAGRPKVLLLDEVGSGLTRDEKEHLARFILKLQSEGSCAVIWIEHDVALIRDLSDHVLVLDYGRKLAEGVAAEVFSQREVHAAFVGARENS